MSDELPPPQRWPPTRVVDARSGESKTIIGYGLPLGANIKFIVTLPTHNPAPGEVERAYAKCEEAWNKKYGKKNG